jgi:ABC-2 type transport system permease protein
MVAPDRPAVAAGVIHDIGYRRHDGQRLGRGYLLRSLAVYSLRGAYGLGRPARSKVMPALLLVAIMFPAVIMVVVTVLTETDELPLDYADYVPVTFYLTAIFLAAQSPQLVSRDLRFRMVPLYFSRPVGYADYVLARYAAMVAALLVLMGSPLLVLYGGALLAELPFWAQTRGVLRGLTGVLLFAMVLAGIGLAIASATPRRGFGVAAIIAIILVSYTVVSIVQGIALHGTATSHDRLALYAGVFTPFNLVYSLQLWLFGREENELFEGLAAPQGWQGAIFALAVLAVVGASVGFLLLRYRRAAAS